MQMKEEGRIRFRCHTGHSYTARTLLSELSEGIEDALWIAIRSLHEGSMLTRQLAVHAGAANVANDEPSLKARAEALDRHADALREIVTSGSGLTTK